MENCSITIGSVPIYEAAVDAVKHKHSVRDMTAKSMLDSIRRHCEDGVDFITVHCGATRGVLKHLIDDKRICGVVSRRFFSCRLDVFSQQRKSSLRTV